MKLEEQINLSRKVAHYYNEALVKNVVPFIYSGAKQVYLHDDSKAIAELAWEHNVAVNRLEAGVYASFYQPDPKNPHPVLCMSYGDVGGDKNLATRLVIMKCLVAMFEGVKP